MRETERQKKIGDRENERPQKLSSPRTGKKKIEETTNHINIHFNMNSY